MKFAYLAVLGAVTLATMFMLPSPAPAAPAGSVLFEAEKAESLVGPMVVKEDKEASGGKYIGIPQGAGNPPKVGGKAVFVFEAPADGDYIFWGRTKWTDGCGNSFTLIMDDGKELAFGQDGTYKRWHWVRGVSFKLSKGKHRLTVANREDGSFLDRILLCPDKKYVPAGMEK